MDNQQKKTNNQQYNFLLRGAIVGGTAAAGAMALNQQPVMAITAAEVNTELTSIATSADAMADTAFPIGVAIVGLGVLAMILRRFIMV